MVPVEINYFDSSASNIGTFYKSELRQDIIIDTAWIDLKYLL